MPGSSVKPLPAADLEHVVRLTREIWAELRGARLLVTGGSGFFGRWMLESLLYANRELDLSIGVWVLTRSARQFSERAPHVAGDPCVRLLEGDVREFVGSGERFTHVLHMAAETNTQMTDPPPGVYYDVIVRGTERVVDAALACGAQRLLLVSSGAVYGAQPPCMARMPENAALAPLPEDLGAAYGQAKRCAEFLANARTAELGLSVTAARCFAFVGPALPLDSGFAAGNFIGEALRERRIVVRGDGTPRRSYMYAADLAIWLWTMLVEGGCGRAYNVGSDEDVSIAHLARAVAGLADPPAEVVTLGDRSRLGVGSRYVPDIRRAREELGLELTFPLEEALARTFDWYRDEPIG